MSLNSPHPSHIEVGRQRGSSSDAYSQSDANIRNFAPVARIMKTALPDNAKIAKEAKECMQECVSEFISFITSEGIWLSVISIRVLALTYLATCSIREMPAGEAQDRQW